jgi:hypothetical protein
MTAAERAQTIRDELLRLAEIAAGILDGEDAKAVITPLAMRYIASPDERHVFLSGDYFDVDHQTFIRIKKLLIRLERLGRIEANCSLWVPVPGKDQVTVAVHNGAHHRYYRFGLERLDTPPEMKQVFATGRCLAVPSPTGAPVPGGGSTGATGSPVSESDGLVTALAPVRDSLGDVVAVLELTAPLDAERPAWS